MGGPGRDAGGRSPRCRSLECPACGTHDTSSTPPGDGVEELECQKDCPFVRDRRPAFAGVACSMRMKAPSRVRNRKLASISALSNAEHIAASSPQSRHACASVKRNPGISRNSPWTRRSTSSVTGRGSFARAGRASVGSVIVVSCGRDQTAFDDSRKGTVVVGLPDVDMLRLCESVGLSDRLLICGAGDLWSFL